MKVLVNAYACSPNMGSEPGMGWNWCVNLARYCELFIITEEEFRDKIEAVVPTLTQGCNMHFYYNSVSPDVRKICWDQGDWRFYWYYRKWQKKTFEIAKQICSDEQIDIIHQLNMIGYREPGLLWKIKGPKYVWGPIGGMETMPIAYLRDASVKSFIFNVVKNLINSFQYRFQPNVRHSIQSSDALVAATKGCQRKIQEFYGVAVFLINETGCELVPIKNECEKSWNKKKLHLLWVGKFAFRKQLNLAIRTIAALKDIDVVLHIAGSGDDHAYKELAKQVGVEEKLVWHGQVDHDDINRLMQQSDIFFFTSIMDATSTVVMEAIQNQLPVVCFDTCGYGTVVDETVGVKIPLSSPSRSVKDFASTIRSLYYDRNRLRGYSNNCRKRIKLFLWDCKAQMMLDIYKSVLKQKGNCH